MKVCNKCIYSISRDSRLFCGKQDSRYIEHPEKGCKDWTDNYFRDVETNLTKEQQESYSKIIDEMISRFKNKEITEWQFRCNAMNLINEIVAKEYAVTFAEFESIIFKREELTEEQLEFMKNNYKVGDDNE